MEKTWCQKADDLWRLELGEEWNGALGGKGRGCWRDQSMWGRGLNADEGVCKVKVESVKGDTRGLSLRVLLRG